MRRIIIFSLLLVVIVHAQAAQLNPINIEANPVVTNTWGEPFGLINRSSVLITFNDTVTLSPGDSLHIGMHFTDYKMLEVINSPLNVAIDLILSVNPWTSVGVTGTVGGSTSVDITRYQNLPLKHSDGGASATDDASYLIAGARFNWPNGEIVNGSCLGDFSFDFTMPSRSIGSGTPDFTMKTYMYNGLWISSKFQDNLFPPVSGPYLRVIPEPTSIFLFSLGSLLLRKSRA